jgi:hypothetical protein
MPLVKVSVMEAEVVVAVPRVEEVTVRFLETVILVPDVVIVPAVTVTVTVFCSATTTPVPGALDSGGAFRLMVEVPETLSTSEATVLTSPLMTTVLPAMMPLTEELLAPSAGTTTLDVVLPAPVTVAPRVMDGTVATAEAPEVLVEPVTAELTL